MPNHPDKRWSHPEPSGCYANISRQIVRQELGGRPMRRCGKVKDDLMESLRTQRHFRSIRRTT
jgi:hypothetical protein